MSCLMALLILVGSLQFGRVTSDQGWLANYLTDLKFLLQDGNPQSGFPKLDPMPVSFEFYVDDDMFRGDVQIDGELSGYTNYFISNATFNPDLYIGIDVIFISTTFQGTYSLDAKAYKGIVPLEGSGPINVYFSYIEFEANGTIIGKNEMIQLKNIDFNIKHINAIQVTAEGLLKKYGLDEVLLLALQNSVGTGLTLYKDKVGQLFGLLAMTEGNKALRNFTISTFLEMIKQAFRN